MRLWWMVLVLALACGSADQEPVEAHEDPGHDQSEVVGTDEAVETPDAPHDDERGEPSSRLDEGSEAERAVPPADEPRDQPTVFTRVMFDLRGMPHRGPHDVDREMVRMRTELLMQRMREAAGDPEPRLTYQPGVSVFRAEFYGPESDALAQCRRAVRQVAPPVDTSMRPGRAAFREPRATPCAPIR